MPQLDAIRTFAKKQLAAGHVVVMMIQKVGNHFPIARRFTLQEGSFNHRAGASEVQTRAESPSEIQEGCRRRCGDRAG